MSEREREQERRQKRLDALAALMEAEGFHDLAKLVRDDVTQVFSMWMKTPETEEQLSELGYDLAKCMEEGARWIEILPPDDDDGPINVRGITAPEGGDRI